MTFQLSASPHHVHKLYLYFYPPISLQSHFIFSSVVYTIIARLASHISSPTTFSILSQSTVLRVCVLDLGFILFSLCYLLLSPLSRTSLSQRARSFIRFSLTPLMSFHPQLLLSRRHVNVPSTSSLMKFAMV